MRLTLQKGSYKTACATFAKLLVLVFLSTTVFGQGKPTSIAQTDALLLIKQFESTSRGNRISIKLPDENGVLDDFQFREIDNGLPINLKKKYPEIKAYKGVSARNPGATSFITVVKNRIYGGIINKQSLRSFTNSGGAAKTNLVFGNESSVDFSTCGECKTGEAQKCVSDQAFIFGNPAIKPASPVTGNDTKTARLASTAATTYSRGTVSKTYRFAAAVSYAENVKLGNTTKAQGMATVTNFLLLANSVLGKELAIKLELIPNNDVLIYLDSSDPYPDVDISCTQCLGQNTLNLDNVIGRPNYDWGFVFFPTFTAWASSRGDDCANPASGVAPSTDVGLALHEMGHQLGCPHAYHLDKSSEIQGITTSIVGSNGGRWFHSVNFEKAASKVDANPCGTTALTGNTVPVISMTLSNGLSLPKSTPFVLTGTATDPDVSTLTYAWQQGGFLESEAADPVKKLLFAHKNPAATNFVRHIPDLSYQLANIEDPSAKLPTVSREIVTRFIVRDNQEPFGSTVYKEFTFNVDASAGPFLVTYPNRLLYLTAGATINVTWDVANTTNATVNVQTVNILFSSDEGATWTSLVASTSNDGSEQVTLPNTPSTKCRIKVEAVGNIFYDISNENFTLVDPAVNDFAFFALDKYNSQYTETSSTFTFNFTKLATFTNNVAVTYSGIPAGASIPSPTQLTASGDFNVVLQNTNVVAAGKYPMTITLTETGGTAITKTLSFTFVKKSLGDGVPGNSLSLATESQYGLARINDITTNTFTISAWVKPKSGLAYSGIIFLSDHTGININESGKIYYHYKDTNYWSKDAGVTMEFDKWNHITLVVEPTKATLYLNGQPGTPNVNAHPVIALGNELRVGRQYGGRNFLGQLDEVRIYNKSLTASEVQEAIHKTVNYEEPSLITYYQFNEASGVAVSPASYDNLTLTGGASRVTSTIPAGDAVVKTLPKSSMLTDFTGTGVSLKFESTTATENATVHKINLAPNSFTGIPASATNVNPSSYWEVNSYPSITNAITDAAFKVSTDLLATDQSVNYQLYRRAQPSDESWTLTTAAFSLDPATDVLLFKNIPATGQYLIYKSNDPILSIVAIKHAFDCFLIPSNSGEVLEYIIQGGNLTDLISLSLTDPNFQLSTNVASGFAPTLQLTPVDGTVNQAVFVKFVGSLSGLKSATLTASSTGLPSKTASFSVSVKNDPYNRGNALSLDGSYDRVKLTNLNWQPAKFTVEFWYKPNNNYQYWNHWIGNTGQFFMHSDGTKIIKVGTANTDASSISTPSNTLLPDKWIHIALTFNEGTGSLYLNGKLFQTKTGVAYPSAWSNLELGENSTKSLHGMMDEFRIWSEARTEQQIQENMHLINDLKTACNEGLKLYYQFENNTGGVIEDALGNYPGTISDNPTIVASSAPVGFGKSQSNPGTTTGVYDFSDVNTSINFSSSPNGKVVVSEITGTPAFAPPSTTGLLGDKYWIINYYGAALGSPAVTFTTPASFTTNTPLTNFNYFKRGSNEFGAWTSAAPSAVTSNSVTFSTSSFSQFMLANADYTPCSLTTAITAAPSLLILQGTTATLTASGGNPGDELSYVWSTGEETSAISVSVAGPYSVTATSGGCEATTTVTVNITEQPICNLMATLASSASTVCQSSVVSVMATVGEGATGYQWYKDGQSLGAAQQAPTLSLGDVQPEQTGSYSLVVTGACGSAGSTAFNLTVQAQPTVVLTFPSSATVETNNRMPVVTMPSGGGLTYLVTGGVLYQRVIDIDRVNGYRIFQRLDNSTGIFPINQLGLYTITVTNAAGCQRTVQGIITTPPAR